LLGRIAAFATPSERKGGPGWNVSEIQCFGITTKSGKSKAMRLAFLIDFNDLCLYRLIAKSSSRIEIQLLQSGNNAVLIWQAYLGVLARPRCAFSHFD